MNALSGQTVLAYERRMERTGVPARERPSYLRWVRFYLDFCQKYGHPPRDEIGRASQELRQKWRDA